MMKIIFLLLLLLVSVHISFGQDKTTEKLLEEAKILKQHGFNDSAIAIYSDILKREPENIQNLLDFADLMIDMENYSYGITLYKEYLELKPDDMKVRDLIITIYTSTFAYDMAEEECISYLKKYPENREMLLKLADIYRIDTQSGKEMVVLEEIVKLQPDDNSSLMKLLDLYIAQEDYKKAAGLLDKITCSPAKTAYIYLNAGEYDKAVELYQKSYDNNPVKENEFALRQAKLAQINEKITRSSRFYSTHYNELNRLSPPDRYVKDLQDKEDDISGIYVGPEYTSGRINNQDYSNYYISFFYPVLSTGTEILLTSNRYKIKSDLYTGIYNKGQIELRQAITENFTAGGGYSGGTQGNTYYGQLSFDSDILNMGIRGRKDFVLETVEAMGENISYTGMDYFINCNITDKCNLLGRFTDYNYSDGNNGNYNEVGGFYRLWDNEENTWVTFGITHTGATYDFQSPFYYSPSDLSQWNYSLEWDYYWTEDSLLRLYYMYSSDNLDNSYNVYSGYLDHKFSDDIFVYGEYTNGLSRVGRIGVIQPNTTDYQLTVGLKVKF